MRHRAEECASLLLPFHRKPYFFAVGHKSFTLQRYAELRAYGLYNQKLLTVRLSAVKLRLPSLPEPLFISYPPFNLT
jgi:hypothetical protein